MKNRDIVTLIIRIAGVVGVMYILRHWGRYWHRYGTLAFFGSHILELIFEVFLVIVGLGMIVAHPKIMGILFSSNEDKNDQNKQP